MVVFVKLLRTSNRWKLFNMNRLSIIIPCFNEETTLRDCVERVLDIQDDELSIELIIVDDALSNNTEEVVNNFRRNNIIYKRLVSNAGASVARHAGIDIAVGEFIAFLDNDDRWHKDKLKIYVDLFAQYEHVFFEFSVLNRF